MSDAPDRLRCFVALPIDHALVSKLQKVQEKLAGAIPRDSVRWTTAEQLHLTLKFLGSVPTSAQNELELAFRTACEGASPFRLTAREVGAFPSLRNPRVLWAGLGGEIDPLQALQGRIEAATAPWAQKAEDREFHPHLTLGRVRENAGGHARQIGEQLQAFRAAEFGDWQAAEVRLMRSQLSPKGSIYTTLAAVMFE